MPIIGGDSEHRFFGVVLRTGVGMAIGVVDLFRGRVERGDGCLLNFHGLWLSIKGIGSKDVGIVRNFERSEINSNWKAF